MNILATIDELPAGYRKGLTEKNLVPIWPAMRPSMVTLAEATRWMTRRMAPRQGIGTCGSTSAS